MEKFIFESEANNSAYRALQVQPNLNHLSLLRRFVVTWHDVESDEEQCLGDLSTDREDSPPCFLILGTGSSGQLLLYIHVPLKINDSPKGMRNTYMIVPAEAFNIDDGSASTDVLPLVHNGRDHSVLNNTGVEAGTKLIWVRFVLREPGYILMPVGKARKPVNERSRGLLLSLKSLSQAESFELYVRDLQPNAFVMRNFFRRLCRDNGGSPIIDYKSTFNGRPWGINAWKSYNLREDETLPAKWNPVLDEAPPSYEETVQSAPGPREKAAITGASESCHGSSESLSASEELAAQDLTEDDNEEGRGACDAVDDPQGSRDSSREPASTQDSPHSHNGREDSEETIILEDRPVQDGGPQQDHRKRSAHEARLDVEPSLRAGPEAKRGAKVRKSVSFAIYDEDEAVRRRAAFEEEPVRILTETAIFHTKSVLARGPNRSIFDSTQYRWFCDVVLWLAAVWRRDHSAHEIYLDEILKLCKSIRKKDREEFERIRLRCMVMFTQQSRTGQDNGPFAYALKDRTQWMIEFFYKEFGPGHDTVVIDELTTLHESACYWVAVGGDKGPTGQENAQEYNRRENGFYFQMSSCLLVACYLWERYEDSSVVQRGGASCKPSVWPSGRTSSRATESILTPRKTLAVLYSPIHRIYLLWI